MPGGVPLQNKRKAPSKIGHLPINQTGIYVGCMLVLGAAIAGHRMLGRGVEGPTTPVMGHTSSAAQSHGWPRLKNDWPSQSLPEPFLCPRPGGHLGAFAPASGATRTGRRPQEGSGIGILNPQTERRRKTATVVGNSFCDTKLDHPSF